MSLLALAFTACVDNPAATRAGRPAPAGPRLHSKPSENVTVPAAHGQDMVDDTHVLQAAVNSGRHVHIPAGTYYVSQPIQLPAYTRVHGDGRAATVIHQTTAGEDKHVFEAKAPQGSYIDSVTVEGMRFVASGSHTRAALNVEHGRHIVVQDTRAEGLSVIAVNNKAPSLDYLNQDIRVVNNHGYGPADAWSGIEINFASGVVIQGNVIRDYVAGVEVWGGDAFPSTLLKANGKPGTYKRDSTQRLARNVTITGNDLKNFPRDRDGAGAGLFLSLVDGAMVRGNHVYNCEDTCLDAEGSTNVTFTENDAGYGGKYVGSVFFDSPNVTWS